MDKCSASTPRNHYECEKYYSWSSPRYDTFYKTEVVEFNCSHCGYHVYEADSGKKIFELVH